MFVIYRIIMKFKVIFTYEGFVACKLTILYVVNIAY